MINTCVDSIKTILWQATNFLNIKNSSTPKTSITNESDTPPKSKAVYSAPEVQPTTNEDPDRKKLIRSLIAGLYTMTSALVALGVFGIIDNPLNACIGSLLGFLTGFVPRLMIEYKISPPETKSS